MWPAASQRITVCLAAHWLRGTRAGSKRISLIQKDPDVTCWSSAREQRNLATMAGTTTFIIVVLIKYNCVLRYCCYVNIHYKSPVFAVTRIGRPPKYRKSQQRNCQSECHFTTFSIKLSIKFQKWLCLNAQGLFQLYMCHVNVNQGNILFPDNLTDFCVMQTLTQNILIKQ